MAFRHGWHYCRFNHRRRDYGSFIRNDHYTKKSMTDSDKFKYREIDLAKALVIPQSVFKKLRKRERSPFPPSEYKSSKSATTLYTEAGLELLCKPLGGVSVLDTKALLAAKKTAGKADVKYGIVSKMNFRNQLIVGVYLADDEETELTVRVGKSGNGNFIYGMIIPIRDITKGVGILARPNPRAKGRW